MPRSTPIRRRLRAVAALTALAAAALPAASAGAAASGCPGVTGPCPYVASSEIGQRGGGVLRFPQAVGVGPDGAVYVGDQGSNVVQVFSPDGSSCARSASPGRAPASSGRSAPSRSPATTRCRRRRRATAIVRFDAAGGCSTPSAAAARRSASSTSARAAATTPRRAAGWRSPATTLYVSDSFNDRVLRFQLDGSHAAEIIPPGTLSNPRGLAVRGTRLLVADDQHHRLAVFDTGGHLLASIGAGQGVGPGQLNFPFGVGDRPAGPRLRRRRHQPPRRPLRPATKYQYKARWGSYGTGPGQLAYPRGARRRPRRPDLRRPTPATTASTSSTRAGTAAALLRRVGPRARASSTRRWASPPTPAASARSPTPSTAASSCCNPDGSIAAVWGSPDPGPTILPNPVAVAFDAAGNAYVLDQRRSRIVVFARATGLPARTIGSQGSGPGQLQEPSALAIDAAGTISVADTGNDRIARFTSAGNYLGSIDERRARARDRRRRPTAAGSTSPGRQPHHGLRRRRRPLTEFGGVG